MTIYAELNANKIVVNVIVADQEFIDNETETDQYIILTNGGIGFTYDAVNKVFIAPQPYPSWTLNSDFEWQPPTPQPPPPPNTYWNENTQSWKVFEKI